MISAASLTSCKTCAGSPTSRIRASISFASSGGHRRRHSKSSRRSFSSLLTALYFLFNAWYDVSLTSASYTQGALTCRHLPHEGRWLSHFVFLARHRPHAEDAGGRLGVTPIEYTDGDDVALLGSECGGAGSRGRWWEPLLGFGD